VARAWDDHALRPGDPRLDRAGVRVHVRDVALAHQEQGLVELGFVPPETVEDPEPEPD
jgi:hypothetical protein